MLPGATDGVAKFESGKTCFSMSFVVFSTVLMLFAVSAHVMFMCGTYRYHMNVCRLCTEFLGVFSKFQNATANFVMSVHLLWQNLAPTGWILMKFDNWVFFWKSVTKIEVLLKSDKNSSYFTGRPMYVYGNILLDSSRMRNVSDRNHRENQNSYFVFSNFFENLAFMR
jgi:hypothetical protein